MTEFYTKSDKVEQTRHIAAEENFGEAMAFATIRSYATFGLNNPAEPAWAPN
jgi:hypothetical protein